jgi:hypothetical protein
MTRPAELWDQIKPFAMRDLGPLLESGGESAGAEASESAGGAGGIIFIIDGGGSAITTGIKGDIEVPFACSILRATLLADATGSIVVDIWKDSYANFPPTNDDSITASAPPTITSGVKSQDTTLSGWTKSISAGEVLRFNVDSAATVTRVTVSLKVALV